MTAPLNTASLVSELARESDPHVIAKLICEALAERDRALESTSRALSEKEGENARLRHERDEALDLAQRSTRRLAEAAEPGFIGAFARRDAAIAERDQFKAQRDEALAALKASEERGERLSQELASARCPHETWQDIASAPEDEWILVATTGGWVGEAMHIAGDWKWASGHVFHSDIVPLKWMPLPEHFEVLENGPSALADATNKDPGTEQREAGV